MQDDREAAANQRGERNEPRQVVGVGPHDNLRKDDWTRRDILKMTAGTAVAAAGGVLEAASKPLFFTPAEFALVDELTEMIIPADDHSPGARAARVAWFIDARLAESFEPEPPKMWRGGLKLVDVLSREMHSAAFMNATRPQREAVLTRMCANESNPKTAEELFFGELKQRTIHAYYTSKIGIHTEMEYKGNTLLTEFVGTVPSE